MMQPERADSTKNFLDMLRRVNGDGMSVPLFSVQVIEKFDDNIWQQHLNNLENAEMKGVYDPALHLPKAIVLTLERPFDEEHDGQVLADVRKEREIKREEESQARKKEAKDARNAAAKQ